MTITATAADAPPRPGEPYFYPLTFRRGDTRAWRFLFFADEAASIPYDLDGFTAAAQMRADPDAARALDLRCEITLPNTIDVDLDEGVSALAVPGVWDLEIRTAAPVDWLSAVPLPPVVRTLVAGPVVVAPDVTRP
jgi:hypothetical protein